VGKHGLLPRGIAEAISPLPDAQHILRLLLGRGHPPDASRVRDHRDSSTYARYRDFSRICACPIHSSSSSDALYEARSVFGNHTPTAPLA
jgi:hypothetical protein